LQNVPEQNAIFSDYSVFLSEKPQFSKNVGSCIGHHSC